MESIQEAFLMLDTAANVSELPLFQRYALILHSVNLHRGFVCTGFQEDDAKNDAGIVQLPADWSAQNADVVSFRYKHPGASAAAVDGEEYYFKILSVGEGKLEVNALNSAKNDEIFNCEIRMEELKNEQFDNLDAWVPKELIPVYEKEILGKLLRKKQEEEKKDQPASNPLLIGGPRSGYGGIQPPSRPNIIGDPYIYPGQSPLWIPSAFKPPGTGPGGELVGPGSSIFHPPGTTDPNMPGIDPATGGGIPYFGGDDPNDINPSFPPLGGQNPFGRGRGMGPPGMGPNFGNPFGRGGGNPFGGGPFGGGGFGGGGFYS